MVDEFSQRYGKLLTGSYDCVDRIVLNAYFSLSITRAGFAPGGGGSTGLMSSSMTPI